MTARPLDFSALCIYSQEQSLTLQSSLIFFMLPDPSRSYSLLGSLLNLPHNLHRGESYRLLARKVVGGHGWNPLPDFLPSGSGICIVKKGSQLFNVELQKDETTTEWK